MKNANGYRLLLTLGVFFVSACGTPEQHSDNANNESQFENPDVGSGDADDAGDSEYDAGDCTYPDVTNQLRGGYDGFLLRGTVLAGDEVIESGDVLVEGELITCVAESCCHEAKGGNFAVVETDGVISPGLIDAHNHLPYNFLPPWYPNQQALFSNRYQWAADADYRAHIAPYGENRSTGAYFCPAAKWGELRSLLHGTTTVQGQSMQQRCINRGVRNADHYHHLGHNHMRTTIDSARDINTAQAQNYIDSFLAETNPTTRFAIHMAEGFAENNIEKEFETFAGRDDRDHLERYQGMSLLEYGTALLIHTMILTPLQLEEIYLTNSMVVWSPSSNIALYGVTAPIEDFLEWDIVTGLGPDWTVSGAFDMLEEMRFAYQYGQDQGIDLLTPKKIWQMATSDGAIAVGLHAHIGRLEPGLHADIAIFDRGDSDPYKAVLKSRAADVELVLIGGEVQFGHAKWEPLGRNDYCDSFDACGTEKFVCTMDGPNAPDRGDESLEDIRGQLYDILHDEYDRGDELLDLVICGI